MPEAAVCGVHEVTGALMLLFVLQLVVVQLLALLAATGAQLATGTFVVFVAGGWVQIVAVQLLAALAATGVQVAR